MSISPKRMGWATTTRRRRINSSRAMKVTITAGRLAADHSSALRQVRPWAASSVSICAIVSSRLTVRGAGTGTGSTGSGSVPGGSASVGGQRVALVTVYAKDGKQYAQTKVGDKVFTPMVGEVFGGSYKLLATNGKTATYLFGDEQFSLTEGQEVLK